MVAESTAPSVDQEDPSGNTNRSSPSRKNQVKVPKRIHKAEREKQKREHLNELFQDLANALELNQQNSGKATILCEATRLLKEIFGQIDNLKKENDALVSESRYVTVEKNELEEENSALEAHIEKLQSELRARVAESKPDLNSFPPEFQQTEFTDFPGGSSRYNAPEPSLQHPPTVFIVPFQPDVCSYPMPASHVSKPHARYPTPADSWPTQLLGEQTTGSEIPFIIGNDSCSNMERTAP